MVLENPNPENCKAEVRRDRHGPEHAKVAPMISSEHGRRGPHDVPAAAEDPAGEVLLRDVIGLAPGHRESGSG